jgi:anti-sigma B factor antagonist
MMRRALLKDIRDNQQRFAALCCRLQELRFTYARLLTELRFLRHGLCLPARTVDLPVFPVYRFVRTNGVLRMVVHRSIQGGSDSCRAGCAQISVEAMPEAAVVHVTGELDLSTAPLLWNAISRAYRRHRSVVIDLSQLDYLDGSGIHALERGAAEHPGRFAVVASKPVVHRIFEILELIKSLPVLASVEAARAYLRRE